LSKILPTAVRPRARSTCCTRPPRSAQPHGVCRRPSALYRVFGRFGLVILPPARNLSGVRIVRNSLSSPTDNCCELPTRGGRTGARVYFSLGSACVPRISCSQFTARAPQGLRRPGSRLLRHEGPPRATVSSGAWACVGAETAQPGHYNLGFRLQD
jgi:hypothetical protein